MRTIVLTGLLLTSVLCGGCVTTGSATQSAVVRAKDRVVPALVHIRPVKNVFESGKREEVVVIGSGFIVSPDGYVISNEHVVGKASYVQCVLYSKEEVEADVVGVDPYTDIAVLKLRVDHPVPYAKLGDSDKLEAGRTVLALGSPHGLARSVSLGIVSITDRHLDDRGEMRSPYNNWIQTDAAINQGNSGGPLVNLKGEVIGVNARMLMGAENVGFAIPINIAREVFEKIRADGRVVRSWIGVELQETMRMTNAPNARGVVIGDVDPLGPGVEAGLQAGDVILSIDGKPVNARFEEDLPAVRKLIADIPVGTQVPVRVLRAEKELDITVTAEERGDSEENEIEFTEWGFTASDISPAMARRAQLAAREGVAVSGTQLGGLAATAKLEHGDIIQSIDGQEAGALQQFRALYDAAIASKKRLVMLVVKRGALTKFILVNQESVGAAEGSATPEQPGNGKEAEEGKSHVE